MAAPAPWGPLFEAAEAEPFQAAVRSMAIQLRKARAEEGDRPLPPSLASGKAGLAFFFRHLAHLWPEAEMEAEAEAAACLGEAFAGLETGVHSPALFAGFTGVAWTLERLRHGFLEVGPEDPNVEVDEVLIEHLRQQGAVEDFDLVKGLVGHGVYALERLDRPTGTILMEHVLDGLADWAQETPQGYAWLRPPEGLPPWQQQQFPNGCYNLGLAHGTPGILALLGLAWQRGVRHPKLRPMLEGAGAWLLAHAAPDPGNGMFGYYLERDSPKPISSEGRVAWCYGDLGVSVALLSAAWATGNGAWQDVALQAARAAAERPVDPKRTRDACLCHGGAGNGHLFHRLYRATGEACFRSAARAWFQQALDHCLAAEQPGDAPFYNPAIPNDPRPYQTALGLLEGSAGVGLAFMAAIDDLEPSWDQAFLACLPGHGLGRRGARKL